MAHCFGFGGNGKYHLRHHRLCRATCPQAFKIINFPANGYWLPGIATLFWLEHCLKRAFIYMLPPMIFGRGIIKVAFLLITTVLCFGEFLLRHKIHPFYSYEAALLSLDWILVVCLAVWCGCVFSLKFKSNDFWVISFLLIAVVAYLNGQVFQAQVDTSILLVGVILGRGTIFILQNIERNSETTNSSNARNFEPDTRTFLVGVVVILAFAAWWHLDTSNNYYRGPRWMGLWDNPNTYGMLMGAGWVLAIGLRAGTEKCHAILLFIAMAIIGVGLVMSCSRGAWLGTVVGLMYLAWCYGKLKWRFVVSGLVFVAVTAIFFWNNTTNSTTWYVKRADLGRPSAQHRAAAWWAGLKMMWDHPLGVGWNNAVIIYVKNYSAPEDGAAALQTNDYLMLGTELGIVALICFVSYVGFCLRSKMRVQDEKGRIQVACRAGAIVLLVAFWFDGGLFKLPTAVLFWLLLELAAPWNKNHNNESTESKHKALFT